jgi:hypothetical protein
VLEGFLGGADFAEFIIRALGCISLQAIRLTPPRGIMFMVSTRRERRICKRRRTLLCRRLRRGTRYWCAAS